MIMKVSEFIHRTQQSEDDIPGELCKQVGGEIRSDRRDGEYASWVNSYKELANVLQKIDNYENIQILLEYNLARTPFRCDVILMGKKNEKDKLLIIELKQWEQGKVVRDDNENVLAYRERKEHPVLQALGYERIFKEGYVSVSERNIIVESCAFLHNYIFDDDISLDSLVMGYESIVYNENGQIKMFGKNDYDKFALFLKESFDGESDTTEDLIFNSEIRLDSFIENIANILKGKPVFSPTEDQNKIIGSIIDNLNKDPDKHQVFIVKGGPGTGKTVLAFNLLTKLGANAEHDGLGLQKVKYVTKNSQLVNAYLSVLGRDGNSDRGLEAYDNRLLNTLFSQINPVLDDKIEYDCLIVDESQRLQQSYQEDGKWREEIIKKIIAKSKNTVFLLDDDQKLAFNDVKFSDQIAELRNCDNISVLPNMDNDAQRMEYTLYQAFRTFGSREHLNWIDRFLGYEYAKNQNVKCSLAEGYDICVVDNPNDLFYMVHDKVNNGESARVLAGLCWHWKDESKDDNTIADIKIVDKNKYFYSWNRNDVKNWSVNPDTIDEVGCVHTVLGQEFDYTGVIIGDDLKYVDGRVLPDPDENTQFMRYDNDSKRVNGMPTSRKDRNSVKRLSRGRDSRRMDEARELVRNHYHILLTRGKKGCYIYCTDPDLRDYLCNELSQESPIHYKKVCDLPVCRWTEDEEPARVPTPDMLEKTVRESVAENRVVGKVTYVDNSKKFAYIKGDDGIDYAVSTSTYNRLADPDSILVRGNRVSFSVRTNDNRKSYANDIKLV